MTCACTVEGQSRPVAAPVQVRQPTLVNEATGDLAAVVRAVIDGRTVELDTGQRVEVSLLAPPADCWAASARTFAEKSLLGKAVRLSSLTPGEVNLRLEDGTDYALLAVREGVLRAQAAAGSLADAELGAAREDRGLWGVPCNGMDATPTTTTAAAPAVQRVEPSKSLPATTSPPPVVTTTPPPPPCAVVYRLDSQWQDGFQGKITIRNTGGAAINGWTLRWSFADGQTVRQMWNASVSQRGSTVTAISVEHTRAISPRGEVEIGFLGSFRGRNTAPTSFTLNGTACTS
ncbi:cellulose-binding domain-containing protein [Lentzea waywayandensis]|uniref:cellulose-binding domain-containing protein n=1 Tax=Lentzea waywayandensis TaxID=84724 RepID=UPI0011604984|nr:cellulose-binding domain-containing protein [Lentzea waywayandensis]